MSTTTASARLTTTGTSNGTSSPVAAIRASRPRPYRARPRAAMPKSTPRCCSAAHEPGGQHRGRAGTGTPLIRRSRPSSRDEGVGQGRGHHVVRGGLGAAALREEILDVPDGIQEIEAAVDHRGGVGVVHGAVVFDEDRLRSPTRSASDVPTIGTSRARSRGPSTKVYSGNGIPSGRVLRSSATHCTFSL